MAPCITSSTYHLCLLVLYMLVFIHSCIGSQSRGKAGQSFCEASTDDARYILEMSILSLQPRRKMLLRLGHPPMTGSWFALQHRRQRPWTFLSNTAKLAMSGGHRGAITVESVTIALRHSITTVSGSTIVLDVAIIDTFSASSALEPFLAYCCLLQVLGTSSPTKIITAFLWHLQSVHAVSLLLCSYTGF